MGRFSGAETYLESNGYQRRTPPDVAGPLACSIGRSGRASVTFLRERPLRLVSAAFRHHGGAGYQVWDDAQPWRQRLDMLLQAVLALPERTDVALVQHSPRLGVHWTQLGSGAPSLPPGMKERHLRYNPHLAGQFVPDARGVQLLTGAHLVRARDLTDWDVRALPGGRHLVQARDLAAWYAQPEVAPAVLAKARDDFGEMILSEKSIRDNPPIAIRARGH